MIKYAKITNIETGAVQIGLGTDEESIRIYKEMGMLEMDVAQSDIDNGWYLSEKCKYKTKEDLEREAKEAKIAQIKSDLDNLDLKSIRAIRANDQEYLAKYEAQAEELRKQLKELSGE